MERVSSERREKGAELEKIRQQIEDLNKAVIVVYASGEFEVAEGSTIELDDTGYDELYAQMRDDEQYEMLRVKDIKILAKAVCYKRNASVKTEFMFDNEELEAKFLQII